MKRIGLGGFCTVLFFVGFASDRALGQDLGGEWTYQYVLSTSDRGADLAYISTSYAHQAWLRTPAMQDLFAETLLRGAQSKDYSQVDLIFMTKILCRANPTRYVTTMNAVAASTSYDQGFRRDDRKLRREVNEIASDCVEKREAASAQQYRPGTINLEAMRWQFLGPRTDAKPATALGKKLLTIRVGEQGATFDDVIATLGLPRHVDIGTPVMRRSGGFRAGGIRWNTHLVVKYRSTNRLHYYYRGVGRVTFTYRNAGWLASEAIADPMLVERELPYRANAEANGQPDDMTLRMHEILYGGYRSVRQAVEVWAPVSFTPEVKDAAAEYLSSHFAPARGKVIDDTFVVLARFLARSDAARYGALIKEIAARSADKRMHKVAESLVLEGADPARQFRPEEVTLDALRHKYPPLYPESTLVGPEGDEEDLEAEEAG